MVTVKKKDRFYGRNSSGNYHLAESEIARLYARRQELEADLDIVLQQEIDRYPFKADSNLAYLYAFVRPVYIQTANLLERLCGENDSIESALWRLTKLAQIVFVEKSYSPYLGDPYQWVPTVDGYRGDIGIEKEKSLNSAIRLEIDRNGNGHFFCGRAAELEGRGVFLFFPTIVAGNVAQLLYLFGSLYDQANYNGQVDVGVAVTGLEGCVPDGGRMHATPYDQSEYRRTKRFASRELLENTQSAAADLVNPLIHAITRRTPHIFREELL